MGTSGVSRRRALTGAASVGIGLPVLAACGEGSGSATEPGPTGSSTTPTSAPATPEPTTPAPGGAVASIADVPVGGGLVVAESDVVITQPTEGDFRGFSATCTHQGCQMREVTETIDCVCHSSSFAIDTGAPLSGPASVPLAEVTLTVDGGQILLA